jgi:hypothetical protein
MRILRFSLAELLAIVLLAAVGSAILAFTINLQVRPLLTLTIGILATATVGILSRRRSLRAFCVGFALFGWSYFVVAFWSPQSCLSLPTTRPLIHLYEAVFGNPAINKPDDVTAFVLWLNDFLQVGHSLVALILALIGGTVTACIIFATRRVCDRRYGSLRGVRP